jgi:hypothetical protein
LLTFVVSRVLPGRRGGATQVDVKSSGFFSATRRRTCVVVLPAQLTGRVALAGPTRLWTHNSRKQLKERREEITLAYCAPNLVTFACPDNRNIIVPQCFVNHGYIRQTLIKSTSRKRLPMYLLRCLPYRYTYLGPSYITFPATRKAKFARLPKSIPLLSAGIVSLL